MKKLILILVGSIFLFFFIIITGALLIAPGSYPYAEPYIVDIEYKNSDSILKRIKVLHPQYQRYVTLDNGEVIKHEDDGFIYYFLPDINYLITCRALPSNDSNQTKVTLVDALDTKNKTGFKSINTKELSKEDNKKIKKEFETEILDKLGKWNYETPGFLRFLGIP